MKNYILAVDPGDVTGWATLEWDGGEIIDFGQIKAEDFPILLQSLVNIPCTIIYEDFILYRNKSRSQVGSRFKASQIIGQLKYYGSLHSIPLIRQPASILVQAAKASGIKQPVNHSSSHEIDAINHGFYYLVQNKRAKTVLEREGLK